MPVNAFASPVPRRKALDAAIVPCNGCNPAKQPAGQVRTMKC